MSSILIVAILYVAEKLKIKSKYFEVKVGSKDRLMSGFSLSFPVFSCNFFSKGKIHQPS